MRRNPPKPTAAWMQRSALAYLERWPTTVAHLRTVMRRKLRRSLDHHGGDPEQAAERLEALLEKLEGAGILDDRRWVLARVDELRRRGTSSRAIQAKLAAKRAPRELVDEALRGDADHELISAIRYAQRRRIGPFHRDGARRTERREKDLGALGRQGFSWDVARRVIDGEREALEGLELEAP
jgi:regulatory protein